MIALSLENKARPARAARERVAPASKVVGQGALWRLSGRGGTDPLANDILKHSDNGKYLLFMFRHIR